MKTIITGTPIQSRAASKLKRSESAEQQAVIKWWAVTCRAHSIPERLLFAVPLQAARTARNGARMKAEGARAGTPDLFLLVARKGFNGMIIEMKREGGRVTPEQTAFINDASEEGYYCAVCYSARCATDAIELYLAFGPAK